MLGPLVMGAKALLKVREKQPAKEEGREQ